MISVRSEVQVLPGPPFLIQVSGAVAQLGEHLLCKQGVVGSIPSGSTIPVEWISPVIRLKESLRTSVVLIRLFCRHREEKICSGSAPGMTPKSCKTFRTRIMPPSVRSVAGDAQSPAYDWRLNRRPPDRSREAGLSCQYRRERSRWALAMRTIKCLKGNWWMPWHAQAMKDVIRCDKLRGGANTL